MIGGENHVFFDIEGAAAVDHITPFVMRWRDGSFSQRPSLGDGQIVSPSFAHDRIMLCD